MTRAFSVFLLCLVLGVIPVVEGVADAQPAPGGDKADALPQGATHRLGTRRFRHENSVLALTISPDGKTVASLSRDQTVRVWELVTGKELARSPPSDWPADVSSVPRSKKLAYCTENGVWLWDWAAGQRPELFVKANTYQVQLGENFTVVGSYAIRKIAFSSDGKLCSWADDRGKLRTRDLGTGKEQVCVEGLDWFKRLFVPGNDCHVAFSPNGNLLAFPAQDNSVLLWSLATSKEVMRLSGHQAGVNALAFSPDGRALATGSDDGTLRLWELLTGKERMRLEGHDGTAAVAFSADGKTLASGDGSGVLRVWAWPDYRLVRKIQGQPTGITCLALTPDGKTVIAGGEDEAVGLWEIASGKERGADAGHRARLVGVAYGPDGRTVATASWDRSVCFWDAGTGKLRHRTEEQEGWQMVMARSPDGKHIATSGGDAAIRLREMASGKQIAKFTEPKYADYLAFCQGGKVLAAARQGRVHLLDAATGQQLFVIEPDADFGASSLACSPGGNELAICKADRVGLWDLNKRKKVWSEKQTGEVAAFSADGKRLAITKALYGRTSNPVVEYDATNGKELRRLRTEYGANGVSVTYVGDRWLACGREDGSILLWEVGTGKAPVVLQSKSGSVWSLAGSPDGRSFVSGHANSTALLWAVPAAK